MKDDLHKKIIDGLSGEIDPIIFETAAVDLLQEIYPTLSPIKGGGDEGRDGHFFNINGASGPLVCTTGVKVEDNLRKSLRQYVKNNHDGRSVIFVTSQKLTPKKQTKLENIAKEEGFRLIKIHEQNDIALRLYRNRAWLKKLLSIAGNQQALSINPVTSRPVLSLSIRGREDVLEWLDDIKGDALVVGQPGSGKTFVVREFALAHDGLFVVSDNREEIAAEIRDKTPRYLIIDDAHTKPQMIQALRQIRQDTDSSFHIIATGWLSQKEMLKNELVITERATLELELQGRDIILAIIKDCGVAGPDALLYQMVTQAEGKPGLAATLCQLILAGDQKDVQDVYIGDALGKHLIALFRKALGDDALDLLAVVAMGGDGGISLANAAIILNISEVRAGNLAADLAFGGVIVDLPDGISVRPAPLRYYLAKTVFFKKGAAIDPLRHLSMFNDISDVVEVAIHAGLRGAVVNREALYVLLEKIGTPDLFAIYAAFGEKEANQVIDSHTDMALALPYEYLRVTPEHILPLLLEKSIGDNRPLHSTTEHPLRIIQDWAKNIRDGGDNPVPRRMALFHVLKSWRESNQDATIFAQGLAFVFLPHFEIHRSDPGAGNSISFGGGHLTPHGLNLLLQQWPSAKTLLAGMPSNSWRYMIDLAEEWAYEQRALGGGTVSPEQSRALRQGALIILKDIAELTTDHPGIQARIKDIAEHLNEDIPTIEDNEFEIIFPRERDRIDWKKVETQQRKKVEELATRYATRDPDIIVARVQQINTLAEESQKTWPDYTNDLAIFLANDVANLTPWTLASIKKWDNPNFSAPFLSALHAKDPEAARPILLQALEHPRHRYAAAEVILKRPFQEDDLWHKVRPQLVDMARLADLVVLRQQADEQTMAELLKYPDGNVALLVAGAIDHFTDGNIPSSLMPLWESALINHKFTDDNMNDYHLSSTLKKHPATIPKWLVAKLQEEPTNYFDGFPREAKELLIHLSKDQRMEMARILPNTERARRIAHRLVGDDVDLFRQLLANPDTRDYQLYVLSKIDGERWVEFAELALESGWDEDDIRKNTMSLSDSWSGPASQHWRLRMKRFDAALQSKNQRIVSIASKCLEAYENLYVEALSDERKEDIYGV